MAKSSFPKADPAATAFFHDLVPSSPGVVTKPMFGHTAAFVNGTMFMGVFGDRVLVRLAEADRESLLAEDGAGPFEPMKGRPMREYVLLPADWQDDPSQAKPWVKRSLAYASSLPPKKPRTAAKKKPASVKPKRAAPSRTKQR
jgi:TfoX/Sxy family transcriptional regulator of competence genes